MFRSYLEQVPAPLRDGMYEKKLADAGILRAYPRSDAAKLGLRERPAYNEVTGLDTQSVSGGVSGTTNDTGHTQPRTTDEGTNLACSVPFPPATVRTSGSALTLVQQLTTPTTRATHATVCVEHWET